MFLKPASQGAKARWTNGEIEEIYADTRVWKREEGGGENFGVES